MVFQFSRKTIYHVRTEMRQSLVEPVGESFTIYQWVYSKLKYTGSVTLDFFLQFINSSVSFDQCNDNFF